MQGIQSYKKQVNLGDQENLIIKVDYFYEYWFEIDLIGKSPLRLQFSKDNTEVRELSGLTGPESKSNLSSICLSQFATD